jgi:hypothetical protein
MQGAQIVVVGFSITVVEYGGHCGALVRIREDSLHSD